MLALLQRFCEKIIQQLEKREGRKVICSILPCFEIPFVVEFYYFLLNPIPLIPVKLLTIMIERDEEGNKFAECCFYNKRLEQGMLPDIAEQLKELGIYLKDNNPVLLLTEY